MGRVRSQFPVSVFGRLGFVVWGRGVSGAVGVVLAVAVAVLAIPAAVSAAPKSAVAILGGPTSGTTGGLFTNPRGVAVNQSGAGGVPAGTVYVADQSNHRIQRLNPDGSFHSAFGQDVVASGSGNASAMQTLTVRASGGDYTLTFDGQTTAAIAHDATPAQVQAALEELSSVGAGNVSVEGGGGDATGSRPYKVTFTGTLGSAAQASLVTDSTGLTGIAPTVAVAVINAGGGPGNGFESCSTAASCKVGITTAQTAGAFNAPQAVAVDQSDGAVYVIDQTNRRVQKLTATGAPVWAAGWDVVASGPGNDTTGTVNQFEVCVPANGDVCKIAAAAGANAGQFAAAATGIAVNPVSRQVVVADGTNRRLQRFAADGAFAGATGYDVIPTGQTGDTGVTLETCPTSAAQVTGGCQAGQTTNGGANPGQFAANQPSSVAVDSSGAVYAVEATGNNRVQKLTPSGSAASTLAPAEFSGAVPIRVAVDQSNDHVYVVKAVAGVGTTGVLEFDGAGNLVETHATTAGLPAASGLDVRTPGGKLYYPTLTGHRIIVLDTPVAPVVSLDDITTFAAKTATFSGTVDPTGLATTYRFEYRRDSETSWTSVPTPDVDSGPINSTNPVSQPAAALEPNTLYYVRLVATKPFGGGSATSPVKQFTTLAAVPDVSGVFAYEIQDTTARLTGSIDPNSQDTSYVFEYGPETSPPFSFTTPAATIGNGSDYLKVSQPITGLTNDTTYHYRLVATNDSGLTPSAVKSFRTRAVARVRGERRYERVSPSWKGPGNMTVNSVVARDGDAVSFCNTTAAGEPSPEITFICSGYVSTRDDDGWDTVAPVWPSCTGTLRNESFLGLIAQSPGYAVLSPMLDRMVFVRSEAPQCTAPLDSSAPMPSTNLYRGAFRADASNTQLLTPQAHTQLFSSNGFADSTDDFDTIVYDSPGNQTPETTSSVSKVYQWRDGEVTLISKDTSNMPFSTDSFAIQGLAAVNTISADGDRVFFHNGSGTARELYQRKNGSSTIYVSQSECTVSCTGAAGDTLEWATADGQRALFMSAAKLTDDATFTSGQNNLYRFVDSANPATDQNLALLSKDQEPADGTSAGVLGVSGISDDSNIVFFVAAGQIVSGGPTAAGPKVYRWSWNGGSPTVQYLATLDPAAIDFNGNPDSPDRYVWQHPALQSNHRPTDVSVTADGKRLILQTVRQLDPVADLDADLDVYRWDELDGWACLSCQKPGAPSAGASELEGGFPSVAAASLGTPVSSFRQRIVMTDDGDRAFFMSRDPLVAADVNGGRRDVYEWDDGHVRLITSGTGASDRSSVDNVLLGIDATGDNVFFITADRLVGWDVDSGQDVYDARVGGGLPEPPPGYESCTGDDCQGPPAPETAIGVATGSRSSASSGNAARPARGILVTKRPTRAELAWLGAGGTVNLAVRVSGAGTVRVTGRSRVGAKSRRVVSLRRSARRAGPLLVPIRLSATGRRVLARRGRLAVALTLDFSKAARLSRMRIVVKAPRSKRTVKSDRKGK